MDYLIPSTPQELLALRDAPISTEVIATAIAGVIRLARAKGQSLEDLITELMSEDQVLDSSQRAWLSEIVASAWDDLA